MRVVVIYKDNTDHAREVTDYMRDFKQQTGHDLETLDPESRDGVSFCRSYDILQFPTLIAISDEGQMQNIWQGTPLPTISEVSYYVK
jgi:protein-disulfide isomerase-like protein with CxxC motif